MRAQPPTARNATGTIIGLDIGGTKIRGGSFAGSLEPAQRIRLEARYQDASEVAEAAVGAVAELRRRSGDGDELTAIGIGIPGRVDPSSGVVHHAVNLDIGREPLDILRRVQDQHDVPVFLENDVNAAALGAYEVLRSRRHLDSLAYLSVGTGIGAGLVVDGRIHRGHHGVGGEIGHFPTAAGESRCICGLVGCLESAASGRAIDIAWSPQGEMTSANDLFASFAAGDERAAAVVARIADQLALAVYLLAVTFDAEVTVVGGGVADVGEPLMSAVRLGIKRLEDQSIFVESLNLGARMILNPSIDVGIVGAAAVAMRGLSEGQGA